MISVKLLSTKISYRIRVKVTTSDLDYIMMWVMPTRIVLVDTFNV